MPVDKNTILANDFELEIDGIVVASYAECEIFDSEYEVVEDREGTDPPQMNLSAGTYKAGDIHLVKAVRPVDVNVMKDFQAWHEKRDTDKRSGAITGKNANTGVVFARWSFDDAILFKITSPKFNARGNDKADFGLWIKAPRIRLVD
jgi:phage tail-like protein